MLERLAQTVEHLRPRLLILDPFVRLHRIDENISGEVARCSPICKQFTDGPRDGVGSTTARQRHRGVSTVAPIGGASLPIRRKGAYSTSLVPTSDARSPNDNSARMSRSMRIE